MPSHCSLPPPAGSPTNADTLFAIAAAVVGGCSLTGGRGTVSGMIIGAALIRTVENALVLGKAPLLRRIRELHAGD